MELSLVALGGLVRRVPFLILVLAGGLGGTLVMALPTAVFGFYMSPRVEWRYTSDDLNWYGIMFAIAAATTGLYYKFLPHVSEGD